MALVGTGLASADGRASGCAPDTLQRVFDGPIRLTAFFGSTTNPFFGDRLRLTYVPCLGETQLNEANLFRWDVTLFGSGGTQQRWTDTVIDHNEVQPLAGIARRVSFAFSDPGDNSFSFDFNPLTFDTDLDFAVFDARGTVFDAFFDVFTGSRATAPGEINLVAIPYADGTSFIQTSIDGFWTPTFERIAFIDSPTPVPLPAPAIMMLAVLGIGAANWRRRGTQNKADETH
ncbi:MAG: hypothetical protein AAF607_14475 [Pseudomonadota bacterium]